MFKQILYIAIFILLSGCAGTFTPSNKMLQLRQGMDKQTAVSVLAKNFKPSTTNSGYCGGHQFMFELGTPLTITPEGYSLQAYKAGDLVSKEQKGGIIVSTYQKVYYQEVRKFADLTKIRVMPGEPQIGNRICPLTAKGGVTLSLQFGSINIEVVHVSDAALDETLAALTTLAPQVKLIQGTGI